jgi:hypothetical protein
MRHTSETNYLGLAGITKSIIAPDCTRSKVRLYTELASTYILDDIDDPAPRRYNILQISGISLWAPAESKGPSWVPYWPALREEQYFWVSDLAVRSSWFSTDHKAPSSRRKVLRVVAKLMMTEGLEVTKSLFVEFVTCIVCGCNQDRMKRLDGSEAVAIANELTKALVEEIIEE